MLKENLIKIYETSFRQNSDLPALTDYFGGDSLSYLDTAREVAKLHLLFREAGIRQGDKIALIGRNNIRWCVTYIATITYGAVIVPILQDFNPADMMNIINHSESRMLFIGDNFMANLDPARMPSLEAIFSLTDFNLTYERDDSHVKRAVKSAHKAYNDNYGKHFGTDDIKYPDIPNDRIILLNYTSGTTGSSKGVMLTVNNLTGNVVFASSVIDPTTGKPFFHCGGRTLSFLPLAHAYGCAFDFLTQLAVGAHITLLGRIPSPKILVEAMQSVRPTIICSVPLVLEKVYRKQIMPMLEKGPMSIAMKIPLLNTALYSIIRSKMMASFGGQVKIFIVGGAPMNQETESFLRKIDFPITIGYGMTECGPLISFSTPTEFKNSSCGRYLKGLLEARIDSTDPEHTPGEILIRGEHVMAGYYKNEEATRAVIDDEGWLHTGDMGTMDPDGTLYIRGRCKTMILTGTGQNIYPEEIEDKLNNLPLVLESLIVEKNGRLTALIVPDFDQAAQEGIDEKGIDEIMKQNIVQLNASVAAYEKVAGYVIMKSEFEKTPKRSIRRFLYQDLAR
ncbi:MAG: AMP-binding protein [Alistipes sp.]|nr:AMP-binding protein [Alistipes sp.]